VHTFSDFQLFSVDSAEAVKEPANKVFPFSFSDSASTTTCFPLRIAATFAYKRVSGQVQLLLSQAMSQVCAVYSPVSRHAYDNLRQQWDRKPV
jgi:hypothetical protein